MTDYLFGYGSLINAESRAKTGKSGQAIPVRVKAVERQWNLIVPGMRLSAVGAVSNPDSTCNGVIVSVDAKDLPKFDKREIGYSRIKIPKHEVTILLRGKRVPQGNLWVYVVDKPRRPSIKNPLIQSYIDVILTGCLNINEQFAREFVTTTTGWNNPWINDRQKPRYLRAMEKVPFAKKIDRLLKELVPTAFSRRKSQ